MVCFLSDNNLSNIRPFGTLCLKVSTQTPFTVTKTGKRDHRIGVREFFAETFVINGVMRSGAQWLNRPKRWPSAFIAASLMRGTVTRSFDDIYEQLKQSVLISVSAADAC